MVKYHYRAVCPECSAVIEVRTNTKLIGGNDALRCNVHRERQLVTHDITPLHLTAAALESTFNALPYLPRDERFGYATDVVIDRWVKEQGYAGWRFATEQDGPGEGIVVTLT